MEQIFVKEKFQLAEEEDLNDVWGVHPLTVEWQCQGPCRKQRMELYVMRQWQP